MRGEESFNHSGFGQDSKKNSQERKGWRCSNCGMPNKKKIRLCVSCGLSQTDATKRSLNKARELDPNFRKNKRKRK